MRKLDSEVVGVAVEARIAEEGPEMQRKEAR